MIYLVFLSQSNIDLSINKFLICLFDFLAQTRVIETNGVFITACYLFDYENVWKPPFCQWKHLIKSAHDMSYTTVCFATLADFPHQSSRRIFSLAA